ncbi:hypothetical protein CEXT_635591 [Caerostris extrusa]|uniref:RNase H type-1 domain-containing protein n=1 Tax=Caerostris extrusa TaxID=172846 RepID=A0AAV4VY22_CAEEX|nr:hypothetical protein CEXT_635591 [Caerostris extrusa]
MQERESDTIPAPLLAYSLEKIHILYPIDDCLHIYTDDYLSDSGDWDSGFYCKNIFEGYGAVFPPATNFDAEIEAIGQVASKLSAITTHNKAVYIINSRVAIQILGSLRKNYTARVKATRILLIKLFDKWLDHHPTMCL